MLNQDLAAAPRLRRALAVAAFAALALAGCAGPSVEGAKPVTTPSASAPAADGVEYTSEDFGYSVTFPGEPVENSTTAAGSDITIALYQSGVHMYMSQGATMPVEVTDDVADSVFAGSISGAVQSLGDGATSTDPVDIEVGGLHGLRSEISSELGDGAIVVSGQGDTLYVMVVLDDDQDAIDAFFSSFRLAD